MARESLPKLFVEHYKIERFEGMKKVSKLLFTEEEMELYEKFVEDRRTEKMQGYKVNRKKPPRSKPPRDQMTPEQLALERASGKLSRAKEYAGRQRLHAFATENGIAVPPLSKSTKFFREALARAGISAEEIRAIEKNIKTVVNSRPCKKRGKKLVADSGRGGGEIKEGGGTKKRQEDDADGAASDGEKKRGDDDAKKYKRELESQNSRKSYARRNALYDRARDFAAMPPRDDSKMKKIENIRSILRQYITETEIKQIEEEALRKYAETYELVERKPVVSRSIGQLTQFFETL